MEIRIEPPPPNDRYQVRFWSTREIYKQFCDAISQDGLGISYTLDQFMKQYIEKRREEPLKGKE